MKIFGVAAFLGLVALISISSSYASDDKVGVDSDRPSPSPSGTEVVFAADFDGPSRLWISSLDGSKLRKISTASIGDTEPAWSPDGRHIAFASLNGEVSDIWIVQVDGAYPVKLTANGANNREPAWSPDGKKIAFVSDKGGSKDIWIMNADGTQKTQVVALPGQENHPGFSPAGDKIVFSETANDAATLMIVNVDGSGLKSLTTGRFQDWEPSWGVNGIVFSSNRDASSERWKIWAIQPDGTGLRKVTNVMGHDPIWTRDGRILFTDESMASKALAAVSIFNPINGLKQVVVDIQGYIVPIDIRPGKAVNRINPHSRGKVEVAILSSRGFDATKAVNQASITFGRTGNEKSLSRCRKKSKDMNNDGLPDLSCRFVLSSAAFQVGNVNGILRFQDANGKPYEGRDAITMVNEDDPDDFNENE